MQDTTLPRDAIHAPDGSEIRELVAGGRASMVHCTLPTGGVSLAVRHRTVEELWFVMSGQGEVWRKLEGEEAVVAIGPGSAPVSQPGQMALIRSRFPFSRQEGARRRCWSIAKRA